MLSTLEGYTVKIGARTVPVEDKPVIMAGIDPTGKAQPLGVASGGGIPITQSGSALPYGADQYTVTSQVTAGPHVIVFKKSGATVKTRTITYTNSGASSTDTITDITDS